MTKSAMIERPLVLAVDDDESFRTAVENFFTPQGYQVCTAGAVSTGMEQVYSHLDAYMVAIVDYTLIGSTGLDFIRRAHAVAAHRMAFYIVTGESDAKKFVAIDYDARVAGALDVFKKDVDLWGTLNLRVNPETNAVLNILRTASEDDLTGLWRRRVFEEKFRPGQANMFHGRRHQLKPGVLFMDVDLFKIINDKYGHLMGDEVLRMVGRVLRGCVRSSDQVFRWGGDEILVLLSDTDEEQARMTVEKIHAAMAQVRIVHGPTNSIITPTLSIGIGVTDEQVLLSLDPMAELTARADADMYRVKEEKKAQR